MRSISTAILFLLTAGAIADEIDVKRNSVLTDEELRKQLVQIPEAGLDQPKAHFLYQSVTRSNLSLTGKGGISQAGVGIFPMASDIGPHFAMQLNPSMVWMPWRSGLDSQLGREPAEALHVLSLKIRDHLRSSTSSDDIRPDPDKLRAFLHGNAEWRKMEAVPALVQLLQAENVAIRTVLVETLSKIEGPEASAALANRAVFDLSFVIRKKAVEALAKRPAAEFQSVLLSGLRYPWFPAASHAAEALAALRLETAAEDLILLLKEPDPRLPYKDNKRTLVREVVKMNHLSNCMVCHAPSVAQGDLVRGNVPIPGEIPPPIYYQNQNQSGLFVRAGTTFLKQDFSVTQPVANSGTWQGNQRFDYLTRVRPATAAEIKIAQTLVKDGKIGQEYKEAVLFALRAITGRNEGSTPEAWESLLMAIRKTNSKP